MRKKLRKMLRRLVVWALTNDEPVVLVNWDINTGQNRFDYTEVSAGSSNDVMCRQIITNTIRQAKFNREL